MLSCLAIQGSSLCGLSFKVGQEYLEVVGNTRITDLPRRDKETAAVPLSLNKIDFVQGRIVLPGGCRYWHVRTLAVLGSKSIKNARRVVTHGRLPPPLERVALSCLAMAKVRKNPETNKRFRDFLLLFRQNQFLSIYLRPF